MLILIVMLPLCGFLSASRFGRYIGIGSCMITTSFVFSSLLLSLILFYDITAYHISYKCIAYRWIYADFLDIHWGMSIDSLTAVMLIVVTFISLLVHIYSIEYMANDPHLPRFMSYLSFFTFFMLILVTSSNLVQMFIGWEGVGLCSFLLINFWFTRIQANKAAIKAMLVNRVGDFFLLLALFFIFYIYKTFDYDVIFSITPLVSNLNINIFNINFSALDVICLFLFLGAMGKSAQIGLHTWLPDAMEGPTPVSALIHAATMVTAGIFLLARCSYLFEFAPNILNLIIIIGSLTAFFAATTGLLQNDIKRIIAYSTCSQLGYMMFACGLSHYDVGVFHLTNHAFFKALLFLGAGAVIHAVSDEQDIRKMGGLKTKLPFYYRVFVIGSLALIGFPFLSGFYSKDIILEVAFAKHDLYGLFAYILGVLGAFCTAFYSTRLLILVFLSNPNGNKKVILNAHSGSFFLNIPLRLLMVPSVFSGYLLFNFFIGFGTNFWETALFILPENYLLLDIEFLPIFYKNIPLLITILGIVSAVYIYFINLNFFYRLKYNYYFKKIYLFLMKKWYFDRIYTQLVVQKILNLGLNYTYSQIDRGLLEIIGPYGITNTIYEITKLELKILPDDTFATYLKIIAYFTIILIICCFIGIFYNIIGFFIILGIILILDEYDNESDEINT